MSVFFKGITESLSIKKSFSDLGLAGLIAWLVWLACTSVNIPPSSSGEPAPSPAAVPSSPTPAAAVEPAEPYDSAIVTEVSVGGNPGAYRFSVTIESPDTGCGQYADWWEVLSPEGELIYRRILLHSHVNEQPFTRSGGSMDLQPEDEVIVRAHMNTTGYGTLAMNGSARNGFESIELAEGFASEQEGVEPLPQDCDF